MLCKSLILSRRGGESDRFDTVLPHPSDPEAGSDHGEASPLLTSAPPPRSSRPAL